MTSSRTRQVAVVLAVVGCLLAAQGCTRSVDGPAVVLRLAMPDSRSTATGPGVQHFVDEVARRSAGTIRVDLVPDVATGGTAAGDELVAQGVARGRWDMGLVPGRTWDELGVNSLRALNTPFLLTDQPALQSVLDSDLRTELLRGLPSAGVTGLDLFPDGLRHPFGYDRPLLAATDYAGQTLESPRSATTYRVLRALGARGTDANADRRFQRGQESSYTLANGEVATGNVTFWPKTQALVVRTQVREHLRADQWHLLRDAAASTRQWIFTHEPTDQESADAFCARGGSIVRASQDQIRTLQVATRPAVRWLQRDPGTRRLIEAIHRQVERLPASQATGSCATAAQQDASAAEQSALNGTYVATVSYRRLRRGGVTNPDQALENSGRFTWVLRDGSLVQHQRAAHYVNNPDLTGTYTYRDGVLRFVWNAQGDDRTSVRVAVSPLDGTLTFSDVQDAHAANQALSEAFFEVPWRRVGGLPG